MELFSVRKDAFAVSYQQTVSTIQQNRGLNMSSNYVDSEGQRNSRYSEVLH